VASINIIVAFEIGQLRCKLQELSVLVEPVGIYTYSQRGFQDMKLIKIILFTIYILIIINVLNFK